MGESADGGEGGLCNVLGTRELAADAGVVELVSYCYHQMAGEVLGRNSKREQQGVDLTTRAANAV